LLQNHADERLVIDRAQRIVATSKRRCTQFPRGSSGREFEYLVQPLNDECIGIGVFDLRTRPNLLDL
jgi:hypothetical protein